MCLNAQRMFKYLNHIKIWLCELFFSSSSLMFPVYFSHLDLMKYFPGCNGATKWGECWVLEGLATALTLDSPSTATFAQRKTSMVWLS